MVGAAVPPEEVTVRTGKGSPKSGLRGKCTRVPIAQATVALLIGVGFAGSASLGSLASASATNSGSARPAGYAGPARQVTTRPGTKGFSADFTSRNWAGYITYASSERTDFDSVKATWVQPAVTCPKENAWTVFWIGLDGWWDDTVEQGGTSAQCIDGVPQYESWWEMYPTVAITTVFAVNPGDKITASVVYKSSTSTYVIVVTDVTTGKTFTKDEQCASDLKCDRSSADVITEDVGKFSGDSYFPLADYKTMKYSGSEITDTSGNSGPIKDSHWLNAAVTESADGTTYATVSALNKKGNGFSATWKHD